MTDKFNIDIKHKVLLEIPHLSKMNFTYLLMTLLLLSKYIFLCIILFAFYKFFSFFGLLHYLIIFIFIISPLNFLFTRSFYSQNRAFTISYINNLKYICRTLSLVLISVPYYFISLILCIYGFLHHQWFFLSKKYNDIEGFQDLKYLVVKRIEYNDLLSIFIFRYEYYSGKLVNGNRNGQGKYVFWNGDVYDGNWKDDRMYGEGSYRFNLGDLLDSDQTNIFNEKIYVRDNKLTIFDGYLSFLNNKYFYLHACLASIVCVLLFYMSYFMIEDYTNHGKEFKLRSYEKLGTVDNIRRAVQKDGLDFIERDYCECVSLSDIDSMKGMIYSQLPEAGTLVKEGRSVLFTFVCEEPCNKKIPLGVEGVSVKIAIIKLKKHFNIQLDTSKNEVNSDEDIVNRLMVKDKQVFEGDMIPEGSLITIYYGPGDVSKIQVPDLTGKRYTEVVDILEQLNLNMKADYVTDIQDSTYMNVCYQYPSYNTYLQHGDYIEIRFQLDSTLFNSDIINDTIF